MKTFSTSGTGSQQTLSEIESDKIPIYNSLTDVTADLANLEVGQIGATKGTGSELSAPVDTVQSGNMHAVTSNAVAESLSYSTTEKKTGGTWIDGKPIYRKVIDCGALPNNTSKDVATGIDFTVCNVIKIEGVAKNTSTGNTDTIPMPFSNVVTIGTTKTGNVSISTTGSFSNYTQSYVTLEYIKTTD